ncbi:hypothetical protein NL676_032427 [Syzygium grande]|nr:hypothetical protein NL676_032427 [Syzygium grande]
MGKRHGNDFSAPRARRPIQSTLFVSFVAADSRFCPSSPPTRGGGDFFETPYFYWLGRAPPPAPRGRSPSAPRCAVRISVMRLAGIGAPRSKK